MKNLKLLSSSSGNYDNISLVHGDAGNYLQVVRCFAYSARCQGSQQASITSSSSSSKGSTMPTPLLPCRNWHHLFTMGKNNEEKNMYCSTFITFSFSAVSRTVDTELIYGSFDTYRNANHANESAKRTNRHRLAVRINVVSVVAVDHQVWNTKKYQKYPLCISLLP